MKRILLLVFLFPLYCYSQKQGNIWYFGEHAGLDFSSGPPVFINGGQTAAGVGGIQEGTASICDSMGRLLMYSNGERLWDRSHQVMYNGGNLMGGTSSTQSSLILPLPGSNNIFYLFTTDDFEKYINGQGKGMRYSIIDMCGNNGLGVVTSSKNVLLIAESTEKLAAVKDATGTGYWVLGHQMFSDAIYAYHLTSNGLSAPVVSNVDNINGTGAYWGQAQGQMKLSADGSKLAVVKGNFQPAALGLFDFNNATGVVTNPRHIVLGHPALGMSAYGVEFSADSKKLYAGTCGGSGASRVYQYDVTAGGANVDSINTSRQAVFTGTGNNVSVGISGMQAGPDNKIYIALGSANNLAVINQPGLTGTACDFIASAFSIPQNNRYTFPAQVAGYRYDNGVSFCMQAEAQASNCNNTCSGTAAATTINGVAPYSFYWQPGNAISATPNNLCTGTYIVRATDAVGNVLYDTVEIIAAVTPDSVTIAASSPLFCANDSVQICAPAGMSVYVWNNGATTRCIYTQQAGNYYVVVSDNNNCTVESNRVAVSVRPVPSVSVTVSGDTLRAFNAVSYQWYLGEWPIDGATSDTYIATNEGDYSVLVTDSNGCSTVSLPIVISGVEYSETESFSVYPNPFGKDGCVLQVDNSLIGNRFEVYDDLGRLLSSSVIEHGRLGMASDLASGVYFISIATTYGHSVKKLVKL